MAAEVTLTFSLWALIAQQTFSRRPLLNLKLSRKRFASG
jgi:hypothetical protein